MYIAQKQCVCWSDKSNDRVVTLHVRIGNEEFSFVAEFRYLGHVMTADCRDGKDIEQQFRSSGGKVQFAISLSGSTHLHGGNSIVQVILLPNLWMCSLASFILELSENFVIYSDTFKRLINVPKYTSSSLGPDTQKHA